MLGRIIRKFDHEAYAQDFEKFVDRVLSLPARDMVCALLGRTIGSAIVKVGCSPRSAYAETNAAGARPLSFSEVDR